MSVGLVGILTALAIPSYRKYIYRSRQHEAQTMLGQIYLAEKSFRTDIGTYTSCLGSIGVKGSETPVRFYVSGFGSTSNDANCGPVTANKACNYYGYDRDGNGDATKLCVQGLNETYFAANASASSADPAFADHNDLNPAAPNPGGVLSAAVFTAMARGKIQQNATDSWWIDQTGNLTNSESGL